MGYVKKVRVEIGRTIYVGIDVLLETDEIVLPFRAPVRRKLHLSSLEKVRVKDGVLSFTSTKTKYRLTLGEDAEKWRARIESLHR